MSTSTLAHSVSENQSDLRAAFTTDQLDFELARRRALPPTLIRMVPNALREEWVSCETLKRELDGIAKNDPDRASGGNENSRSREVSTNSIRASCSIALSRSRTSPLTASRWSVRFSQ